MSELNKLESIYEVENEAMGYNGHFYNGQEVDEHIAKLEAQASERVKRIESDAIYIINLKKRQKELDTQVEDINCSNKVLQELADICICRDVRAVTRPLHEKIEAFKEVRAGIASANYDIQEIYEWIDRILKKETDT